MTKTHCTETTEAGEGHPEMRTKAKVLGQIHRRAASTVNKLRVKWEVIAENMPCVITLVSHSQKNSGTSTSLLKSIEGTFPVSLLSRGLTLRGCTPCSPDFVPRGVLGMGRMRALESCKLVLKPASYEAHLLRHRT